VMKRHALFGELAASLVARVDAMPHAIIRMSIISDATICPSCHKFCTAAVRAQLEVCIHEFWGHRGGVGKPTTMRM
jgi:hypothetical protein